MSHATRLTAAALAAAISLPALAAAAEDTEATAGFDSVAVTVEDGAIVARGAATFGGETVVVGEDETGDALLPGSDFGQARLSQDPKSGLITAELELVDGLPEFATSPEGVYFEWNVDVPGTEGFALTAKYTNYNAPGAWYFAVTTYSTDPATGTGSFSNATVDGEYTGSELVWRFDAALAGAKDGDAFQPGTRGPIRSTMGGAGLFTFSAANFDDMVMTPFALGGGARVVVRDAAGEEVDAVKAKVRRGEFTAIIDGLSAGTYTVEVTTQYGTTKATETFTVTV